MSVDTISANILASSLISGDTTALLSEAIVEGDSNFCASISFTRSFSLKLALSFVLPSPISLKYGDIAFKQTTTPYSQKSKSKKSKLRRVSRGCPTPVKL